MVVQNFSKKKQYTNGFITGWMNQMQLFKELVFKKLFILIGWGWLLINSIQPNK